MAQFVTDFKSALRSITKRLSFSLLIVVLLAIGIGANTTIFSVVHPVLLQPLPFEQPDQLVFVWHVPPAKAFPGFSKFAVSPANFIDWQRASHAFDSMAAFHGGEYSFGEHAKPETIAGQEVGPDFFKVLRAQAIRGRVFGTEDGDPKSTKVTVISESFWKTEFNSNPNVIGQTAQINAQPYTIIGIIPENAVFPPETPTPKVWICLQWDEKERAVRGNHNYLAIGRLKPGVSLAQANSELASISQRLQNLYPADDGGWGAKVTSMREEFVGDVRAALFVLTGAVVCLLLIACANVMNLVLANTLARRKELAIRSALGARRVNLIRQVAIETMMLALAGGLLGAFLAKYGIALIVKVLSNELPRLHPISINFTVLMFTLLISLIAGLLAGLYPAWRSSKANISDALNQGLGKTDADSGGSRTRNLLVISEVSLTLVLLFGAGLMIRTFYNLQHTDIGIDTKNVLTMTVQLPKVHYSKPEQQAQAFDRIVENLRALPGVYSASIVDSLPLLGGSTQPILIEGRPVMQMADQPEVPVRRIGAQYLKTMRIPVLRGRDFSESDTATSPPVVLVTQSFARQFFPNEDPVGKRLSLELTDKYLEMPKTERQIVGIVGDAKLKEIEDDQPMSAVYLPYRQVAGTHASLVLRTTLSPATLTSSVAKAVHSVDNSLPLTDVATMDEVLATAISQRRFNMLLLIVFAGCALLLAGAGIYSMLSYSVRRRVREIGIRMALGARVRDIVQMVIADSLKPTVVGGAIGLVGALALGPFLSSVIYEVSPYDLTTFIGVCFLLLSLGIVASVFPARRAARVDPVSILRQE